MAVVVAEGEERAVVDVHLIPDPHIDEAFEVGFAMTLTEKEIAGVIQNIHPAAGRCSAGELDARSGAVAGAYALSLDARGQIELTHQRREHDDEWLGGLEFRTGEVRTVSQFSRGDETRHASARFN